MFCGKKGDRRSLGALCNFALHEFVISPLSTALMVVGLAAVVLCAQPQLDEVVATVRSFSATTEQ
jgi:hypothetical protein